MRQMLAEVIKEPMTEPQAELCDAIFRKMCCLGVLVKVDKFPEPKSRHRSL